MQRRIALVALWLVFAVAAVGVGFGAANLVDDPYTGSAGGGVLSVTQEGGSSATTLPTSTSTSTPSSSATSTPHRRRSSQRASAGESTPTTRVATTSTARPAPSPSRTRSASPRPARSTDASSAGTSRTVTTSGGVVTATCRGGLVSVGASPAVGWTLERASGGWGEEAEVKFRPSDGAEGEVEVHVVCASGTPRFEYDDHAGTGSRGD